MAAVSLSDAWNDAPELDENNVRNTVAARFSATSAPSSKPLHITENDEIAPEHVLKQEDTDDIKYLNQLIIEIKHLRNEESKRCTTYLIMAGILFALLFLYIEKLHSQVKTLNTIVYHQLHSQSGGNVQSQYRTQFR